MRLYNSLTKQIEVFEPLDGDAPRIYSCGPTVYDRVHIGNLSAFIVADTLRRTLLHIYPQTRQVMNLTDVDDKTIKKAATEHNDLPPNEALKATTEHYADIFFDDMKAVGNDIKAIEFVRATDAQTITDMQELIAKLYADGFAYMANDGVYFSIDAYRKSGKTYGQLTSITADSTANARIQNDEYDKESVHDFALWKTARDGEPSWEFTLDGHDMRGRPGWHIECSAMSVRGLGLPFDIHTGGIDLKFPHHENEIAQSTAGQANPTYAKWFVHNDHILVDGRKMAKSEGNFYTLTDLSKQKLDPIAFRMLVLQSHYRNPTNFSFDNATAAANRLSNWRSIAALRHQTHDTLQDDSDKSTDDRAANLLASKQALVETMTNDLDTPTALSTIDHAFDRLSSANPDKIHRRSLVQLLEVIDELLGLDLIGSTPDISDDTKQLLVARQRARDAKDWQASDEARDQLAEQGIGVRDTSQGSIWFYL